MAQTSDGVESGIELGHRWEIGETLRFFMMNGTLPEATR